ncbi:hypothetical protein AVEN_241715-1 [Araneus ventricosus]|uniref:Uncharacterized protein n=1 Tax=Araneus ventricosus TaxID=182803 RepID=A0A4Y2X6H5_ARAVE|nr:hypothetical protein AVEN_241715-1 [Araneus ventricosus]
MGNPSHTNIRTISHSLQNVLNNLWRPNTPATPCIMHAGDKGSRFTHAPMQLLEDFSVCHVSSRETLPLQSFGVQIIPIRKTIHIMHVLLFLITVRSPCLLKSTVEMTMCKKTRALCFPLQRRLVVRRLLSAHA